MYVCRCTYVYIYIYICVCVCAFREGYSPDSVSPPRQPRPRRCHNIYICINIYIYIYLFIYVCMYICVNIYICICECVIRGEWSSLVSAPLPQPPQPSRCNIIVMYIDTCIHTYIHKYIHTYINRL